MGIYSKKNFNNHARRNCTYIIIIILTIANAKLKLKSVVGITIYFGNASISLKTTLIRSSE